jgi:hypothetical protein
MTIMHPVKMPADAAPAIALPMMKAGEFGAAPQMAEPISKTTTLIKNVLGKLAIGVTETGSCDGIAHHFML